MLHFEEIVCISVYIRFWCSSQPDQNRIEIFKNRTIFFEDTAVAFIHDN